MLSKQARTEVARARNAERNRLRKGEALETMAEFGGAFAGGALFGSVSFLGGMVPANYLIGGAAVAIDLLGGRRMRRGIAGSALAVARGMALGQAGIQGQAATGGDFLSLNSSGG